MTVWNHPATIYAGRGAARNFADHARALCGDATVLADATVAAETPLVDEIRTALSVAGVATRLMPPVSGPTSMCGVRERARTTANQGAGAIIAIGGGATLDTAKLVAAGVRKPAAIADAVVHADRGGAIALDLPARVRPPFVFAVPTTVGTGSEVSPSACVEVPGARLLLQHFSMRPVLVLLDPAAVATTPRAIVALGALEIWLRCIGPVLGEAEPHPFEDRLAVAVARGVVADGELAIVGDEDARHRLARASSHTHTGELMLGRDPYSHMLWYLAADAAHRLRITKMEATAALLPTYLRWLVDGRLPGTRQASDAHCVLTAALGGAYDSIEELLDSWDVAAGLCVDPTAAAELAEGTQHLWRHRPNALRGMSIADLTEFYANASAPRSPTAQQRRTHHRPRRIMKGGE